MLGLLYENKVKAICISAPRKIANPSLYEWVLTFIIKGFQTIVFIFIVISTMFRLICPPAFFWWLSNLGTYTELHTTSFIESIGVTCFDSISHNRVQVLSIPVLLLACSQDWTCNLQMIVSLEAREPTPITGDCWFNPDCKWVTMQEYLTLVPSYC